MFETLVAQLLVWSLKIKNQTQPQGNTATLVGGLFEQIVMLLNMISFRLANVFLGINLKGDKKNESEIKESVDPKKGDTYKSLETNEYWSFDGDKWNNIGDIIPSDVSNKADKTIENTQVVYLEKPERQTEYPTTTIDKESRILELVRSDGTKQVNGLEILDGANIIVKKTNNQNVIIDKESRILELVRSDGTKQVNGLEILDGAEFKATKSANLLFALTDREKRELLTINENAGINFKPSDELISVLKELLPQPYSFIPNLKNNTLPKYPKQLRILGIGNSFTDDGMEYLPNLCKAAGLENITFGKLIYSGCSLAQHWDFYANKRNIYEYYAKATSENTTWRTQTSRDFQGAVADEPWDIIVIQQASPLSGLYDTFQPYLFNLIDAMKTNCSNAGVILAWHSTWAYANNSTHEGFKNYNNDQTIMFDSIIKCAKKVVFDTGIDLVIPSSTAIQSLRTTSLNTPLDLTRDGYHIDLGIGRYTLACTWFESLIAPCYDISIANNTFRTQAVTDSNYRLCQWAAQYAASRRFEITNLESQVNINS